MKRLLFFLAAASAWAQPALAPPQLGFVADTTGALRPVHGVAGNFLVGSPDATGVTAAAFSGSFGLLKTDSAVMAFDGRGKTLAQMGVAAGTALFAFLPAGEAAIAYIAQSGEIVRFSAGRFIPRTVAVDAASVVAVAFPNIREATLIEQREDGLWQVLVELGDGHIVSQTALNGLTAPVLALPSGDLVAGDAQGIVVKKADGSEVHIAGHLPAHFELRQMGGGWVEVNDLSSSARFAVRVTAGHEGFYMLPEVRP